MHTHRDYPVNNWLEKYVQFDDSGTHIERANTRGQADLAEFIEQWAQNLIGQGRLERCVRYETKTEVDISVWPEATTPFLVKRRYKNG